MGYIAVLAVAACARPSAPVGPQPQRQAHAPSEDGPTAQPDDRPAAAPTRSGEAASSSPKPKPKLTAPDGTVIEPCGEPPQGMACIPGGPFIFGSDDGPENTRPARTVWLQTFYMDLYEVTNEDYRACKKSKQCLRGGPLYNDFSRAKQPIVGPSWFAAVKYCEVKGKHLPTEAQWEKAARGPDGALHPWGDEPATCDRAVIKDSRGRSCGVDKRREHPKKGRTFVVGTRPPGVYGLYDMSGNAWEWVYDWASKDYGRCGDACAGTDPRGPCDGALECRGHRERVVRGGSWYWDKRYATAIYRRTHVPGNDPFHHFGFRCAASLAEAAAMTASSPTSAPAEPQATPQAAPSPETR